MPEAAHAILPVGVKGRLSKPGKEKAMCIIHICVQCSEKFSELVVSDVQDAELTVESIVGTALLEIFDTVCVDDVKLFTAQSRTINIEDEQGLLP